MTKFSKNPQNIPFLGPFCPNLGKNKFSTNIGLCHVGLLHANNQKKLMRQLCIALSTNRGINEHN